MLARVHVHDMVAHGGGGGVKESVYNKAFQDSKNDYWKILSITTNLFYFCLFSTDETNKL